MEHTFVVITSKGMVKSNYSTFRHRFSGADIARAFNAANASYSCIQNITYTEEDGMIIAEVTVLK